MLRAFRLRSISRFDGVMLRAFRPEASRVHCHAFWILRARSFATKVAPDDANLKSVFSVQLRDQSCGHPGQARRQIGNLLRRPGMGQASRCLRHPQQAGPITQ